MQFLILSLYDSFCSFLLLFGCYSEPDVFASSLFLLKAFLSSSDFFSAFGIELNSSVHFTCLLPWQLIHTGALEFGSSQMLSSWSVAAAAVLFLSRSFCISSRQVVSRNSWWCEPWLHVLSPFLSFLSRECLAACMLVPVLTRHTVGVFLGSHGGSPKGGQHCQLLRL